MFSPREERTSGSQAEDGQKEVLLHAAAGLLLSHCSWRGLVYKRMWEISICSMEKIQKKIPHTGNTRPSCTCLIQKNRYYTMSLSLYNDSLSIPWVQVYTISLSLYHESFSISCIQFYTMSPSLYHDSKSIPWVLLYTMSLSLYHESKSIPWIQVYTTL